MAGRRRRFDETYRVARHQSSIVDSTSTVSGLGNEVVAYDTAAHAAQALSQWEIAAATCPHTTVRSTVAGQPDALFKITKNELDVGIFPATTNAVTTETATIAGPHTLYMMSILQVHGRYLDAIYLTVNRPLTTEEIEAIATLAIRTGRRLITHS